jgi:hypothetical protein
MKKIVVLAGLIAVMATGIAWAHGGWGDRYGFDGYSCRGTMYGHHFMEGNMREGTRWISPNGNRPNAANIPQEIQNKWNEMRRSHLQLQLELSEPQVDRNKATALHEKILSLRQELARWMFKQQLNRVNPSK